MTYLILASNMTVTMKWIWCACVAMVIVQDTTAFVLDGSSSGHQTTANPVDFGHGEEVVLGSGQKARLVFSLADLNQDLALSYNESKEVFIDFDVNGDGNVTASEFLERWKGHQLGGVQEGLQLFLNLDVNKDFIIEQGHDMPFIFRFFDRNDDRSISQKEFVEQWLKISLA